MVAGRCACRANKADDIPLLDLLPHADVERRVMGIQSGIAAAVIDHDIISVAVMELGHHDRARLGGIHVFAGRRPEYRYRGGIRSVHGIRGNRNQS